MVLEEVSQGRKSFPEALECFQSFQGSLMVFEDV